MLSNIIVIHSQNFILSLWVQAHSWWSKRKAQSKCDYHVWYSMYSWHPYQGKLYVYNVFCVNMYPMARYTNMCIFSCVEKYNFERSGITNTCYTDFSLLWTQRILSGMCMHLQVFYALNMLLRIRTVEFWNAVRLNGGSIDVHRKTNSVLTYCSYISRSWRRIKSRINGSFWIMLTMW